ncbi:hypothetical protein Sar04_38620 [Salinispora arenicola]|uniref:Uncharacterized protein n=1 Tax=Salinispora arenicola TaxID=168697 RepID=A0ABQ4JW10_SALAC|nr:hypothetical protein [Salinispora arenicola]GIM87126.1 hypothetical protein Sar04_38620 [Salinispora arenicola]
MLLTQPALGRRGQAATVERLRRDRQLEEALAHGGDPLHLAAVFGIDAKTAIRYATTARQLLESAAEHHDAQWFTANPRADTNPLDQAVRGDHAADMLAAFLKALHMEAPADAPDASDFGAHPKECMGGFEYFLQAVDLGGFAEDDIRAVWDDAVATPEWPGPRVWVHDACIPRTSSSQTARWQASSTSAHSSPAIRRGTSELPGCCFPRKAPRGFSTATPRRTRRRSDGRVGWPR